MKPAKIFSLAILAAIALMASVGPSAASAGGVFCEANENPCKNKWAENTIFDFVLEFGTSAKVATTGGTVVSTCPASTFEPELNQNPDGKGEATARMAALTFGNVTEPCTSAINTIEMGKIRFANITGTLNGTVRVDEEIKVTATTSLFGKCVYGAAAGTDLGELKEGKVELGSTAPTLAINTVLFKKASSEDSCVLGPEDLVFTASYVLTRPEETTLAITEK